MTLTELPIVVVENNTAGNKMYKTWLAFSVNL